MSKTFNVNGDCKPELHYMVDVSANLQKIKGMIEQGQYFVINRARQYGKTTTLRALERYLKENYYVVSLDFQMLSYADFESENAFVAAFAREFLDSILDNKNISEEIKDDLQAFADESAGNMKLALLFRLLSKWCKQAEKPIVLIIDEVDSATNNQVFLDFLAQLRGYYLKRDMKATFRSVILAGVYDIKNLKFKIRSESDHKYNSPWNIAADFNLDMSFNQKEIGIMLEEYETDHVTGMDIKFMSFLIYDYTAGYPYLVSRLCKLIDEQIIGMPEYPDGTRAWTADGFQEAVRKLLKEQNTLFDDVIKKLTDHVELKNMIKSILFNGRRYSYEAGNPLINLGQMFGFLKEEEGVVTVSNRIFEMKLYNWFISEEETNSEMYKAGSMEKNQFISNGFLQMDQVMKKFFDYFTEIYSDADEKFLEENGRRLFLIFLKPIINGTGNYYIEARTRNMKRTDVIIDYKGEQHIVELKIWRGQEYNKRGEKQLFEYLDFYHKDRGYLLSFNFNQNKNPGISELKYNGKTIMEIIV